MTDFRCYCETSSPRIDRIELAADESHHLIAVNRARRDDEVVVFNGRGVEWQCTLIEADRRKAVLKANSFKIHKPPSRGISLVQAPPKGKGLESIVRKATELGAASIYPIITARTELKIITDRQATKQAKLNNAAIEGAKQSGNPFLPKIHPAQSLQSFLENTTGAFDLRLIGCLREGTASIRSLCREIAAKSERKPKEVAWLIGPEGDFTDEELDLAISCGFHPISLGPYVLRCETAATAALSLIHYELSYD